MENRINDPAPVRNTGTIQTQTDKIQANDPYEGIFYNIQQNDAKTNITFNSAVLCNIIKTNITADFNQPNEVTLNNISTRVQNVKCLLSLDLESQELEISGMGHKMWTESKFKNKMPAFLNKLVNVTNTNVELLKTSPPICEQLSHVTMETTPYGSNSQENAHSSYSVSEKLIDTMCEAICKLKDETNTLRQDLTDMQHQRPTYAAVLNRESSSTNKAPGNASPEIMMGSRMSENGNIGTPVTAGETLSEQPIKVVISDRRTSNDATTLFCVDDISPQTPPQRPPTARTEMTDKSHSGKKVLMMGDSILHGVNVKGLKNNLHKHSVSGATIHTLIRDIEMYDLNQFHTVIIYIGGNDLSRTTDFELIEEKYDQLIALIKAGNEECKLILSKIAPRGDVDVNPINKIIERLSIYHKTEIVDCYRAFHDQNGKLLMRYLNEHDTIHLSRPGTKRLLSTFHTSTPIVEDYTKCVFPDKQNFFGHQSNRQYRRHPFRGQRHQNRCMNCDESSHATEDCRHRAPVKCWGCGLVGHKQDRCWN